MKCLDDPSFTYVSPIEFYFLLRQTKGLIEMKNLIKVKHHTLKQISVKSFDSTILIFFCFLFSYSTSNLCISWYTVKSVWLIQFFACRYVMYRFPKQILKKQKQHSHQVTQSNRMFHMHHHQATMYVFKVIFCFSLISKYLLSCIFLLFVSYMY